MIKARKHFKTIMRHKWYVMVECFKVGLYRQGIVHDLSKFSITEFMPSARYFQGDKSPTEKERIERWYSEARLHHKGRNKHHQHYWIDIIDDKLTPVEMPEKYVLELCCDFIGAGKAYNPKGFNQKEPLKYFQEKVNKARIHPKTVKDIEGYLVSYAITWKLK